MSFPLSFRPVARAFTSSALKYAASSSRAAPATGIDAFKDGQHAEFVAAAVSASALPDLRGLPEVIVAGRANVGKSTLLNAVANRKDLFHVGKTPGKTKMLNFFRIGAVPGHLVLVDAPGYGARGRREWGQLFDAYVSQRKELRRIYILFNAKHGISSVDEAMLAHLEEKCITSREVYESADHSIPQPPPLTMQAIITKADLLLKKSQVRGLLAQIKEHAPSCMDPIVTAAGSRSLAQFGIPEIRASVAEACGIA
ncbi:P-loop containing nucleoside triphosphate hydrolase protein [Athelia psychrophila]|uniref:P-loop containing nucleoside triphosphate hydrolase protein n=1 Tax=Athelia psychrophila TaxID=1759441 RepID=A0A166C1V7_9AGAM|nr:P-loop containing nucleoside triphosphate hydrolase protein [Fibularhizoctonia sp. CBS 109695]